MHPEVNWGSEPSTVPLESVRCAQVLSGLSASRPPPPFLRTTSHLHVVTSSVTHHLTVHSKSVTYCNCGEMQSGLGELYSPLKWKEGNARGGFFKVDLPQLSAGRAYTRQHACSKVYMHATSRICHTTIPQIATSLQPKMQSSTSESPGSFDLESIYQDALNQLQSMRVRGQITSADYDLITTTRKPSEILGTVQGAIASQMQSDARTRVSQVLEPLLERLERFGSAMDMIVGAVPQIMGVSVLGLVWGSFKFLMIMARDVSDAFSTVLDVLEDARNSLPTLDVYIRLFGSSNIQLLRRPLVEMYSHLMVFGIEAMKLFNRSMLATFGKAASSGLSKELQALTAKIAKSRDEVDRVANLEHMHQNDAALKVQAAENRKAALFRQEMRSLLEKTHDGTVERPIPRINDAPVRRVSDHFTGREKELEYLRSTIDSWSSDAPALFVIYGSPGRGKSQLALHYADQSFTSRRYSHIFWASATTIEKASQGVANVLDLIDHKDRHHPEQTVRLRTARLWLENADRHGCPSWLFIFDNAIWDTVPFLLEHLPLQNGHDTILVTTRTLDIAERITNAAKQKASFLDLPPLSSAQSVELFLKRAQLDGSANVNPGDIEKLVKQFGCLPLAIDQAGAYVKQKHLRIDKVQSRDVLGDILTWENNKQVSYEQHSVAAVFNVQLQNLDALSPDASNLLKTVAFYDPESIPINILARGAQNLKREPVSPEAVIPAMGQKPSVVRRIVAHFPWNLSKSPVPASHKSSNVDRTSNCAPSRASKLDHLVELMCSEDWLREAASHFEDLSLAQP
ncbi:hypothetical protein HWV62_38096, partial [Athelia sp. TMB]